MGLRTMICAYLKLLFQIFGGYEVELRYLLLDMCRFRCRLCLLHFDVLDTDFHAIAFSPNIVVHVPDCKRIRFPFRTACSNSKPMQRRATDWLAKTREKSRQESFIDSKLKFLALPSMQMEKIFLIGFATDDGAPSHGTPKKERITCCPAMDIAR